MVLQDNFRGVGIKPFTLDKIRLHNSSGNVGLFLFIYVIYFFFTLKMFKLKINVSQIHIDNINKIADAKRPLFEKLDEQVVFDFSVECNLLKSVSDEIYDQAIDLLGQSSIIDLVGTCGYYNLISMEGNKWVLPKIDDFTGMMKNDKRI